MTPHSRVQAGIRFMALMWFVLNASPFVSAQQKKPLDPQTIAILGEPDRPASELDADVIAVLGSPAGSTPSDSALSARASEIGSKLRCPVCQGVAIADSPAGLAVKMRGQVRELVAKGYSEDQVVRYFERSYGEFVRLEPPMRGLNLMLWILPVVMLLGGVSFVVLRARPSKAQAGPGVVPIGEQKPDPALAKYVERIRRDAGISS